MDERKQIVTIKEARKLLGKVGQKLSDEEVTKLIDDLDFFTRHAIKQFWKVKTADAKPSKQHP